MNKYKKGYVGTVEICLCVDAAQWLAADAASGRGDGRYQMDLSTSGDHDVEDAAGGPNR